MFKVNEIIPNAHDLDIWSVAWHGGVLATGSLDQTVRLWRPGQGLGQVAAQQGQAQGQPQAGGAQSLKGHSLGVVSVDVRSDGLRVASSGLDSVVNIFDATTGKLSFRLANGPGECYAIRFSPGAGQRIAGTSKSGALCEWDAAESGKCVRKLETGGKFGMSLSYSPVGDLLCCGGADGVLSLFSLAEGDGKRLHRIEAHGRGVRGVAFSNDGTLVASASDDGRLSLWDTRHASLVHSFSGHRGGVLSVAWSSGGLYLATGSADSTVKVWDMTTRHCLYTFSEHRDSVWALAFDDNGTKLASAGDDKALHIYDVA